MYQLRRIRCAALMFVFIVSAPMLCRAQNQDGPRFTNDPFDEIPGIAPPSEMGTAGRPAYGANQVPSLAPQGAEPDWELGESTSNTVSVAQLKHPLSRKGASLLHKVASYLKHHQKAKANEQLAEALKEPTAAPYAHAILGTEYLKDGQIAEAVPELESAAQVLPISGVHSNLGYALCLMGHINRGRMELNEALRLDGDSPQARFLMGVVLLNQKSEPKKAEYNLKLAQDRVPSARLALAVCHILDGQRDAAEAELHEYLGPNKQKYFAAVWKWATGAAANPRPAAAFGFQDQESN